MTDHPCYGKHELFDSTYPGDHMIAKALCDNCPAIEWCRENTQRVYRQARRGVRKPLEGTWAGKLYGGDERERWRWEDSNYSADQAREAHNTFNRARYADRTITNLGEWVVTGERVYQRRKKQAQKEAGAVA